MPPPSKPLLALLLLGTSATAFLAGRQTAPDTNARILQELASQRAVLDTLLSRTSTPDTRCAIAASGAPVAATPSTPPAAAPSEPSAENLAAAQEGQRLIDAALRVKRWTSQDAQAFRVALVDMTPDQRTEALRQLLTTINSQALQVQTGGMPF
ncbi:hypothetical protein LXT21_30950 [Myxococcus sp. K38C18041901]|uniref:hypothetical protein n=1 Tax=Myxococcus guangdongensis TaxID=2906760 RepID=UPI0020A782C1|nr:hypothetical protein [Myxococcus guangdongensis]MCP3063204.1 hypothetical protein [Myxococcus guangdongensis]